MAYIYSILLNFKGLFAVLQKKSRNFSYITSDIWCVGGPIWMKYQGYNKEIRRHNCAEFKCYIRRNNNNRLMIFKVGL